MTGLSRRSIALLLVAGSLTGVQVFAVARPASSVRPQCERLHEWAARYRNTHPTLQHLATFDRARRLAVFDALSPDVRASLWREHLREFSDQPALSSSQRALVLEAASLMTPALYRSDEGARSAMRAFWQRAEGAFASPDLRRPWLDLAPASVASATFARQEQCMCRWAYECSEPTTCVWGACRQTIGCGVGGLDFCKGFCQ